MTSILIIFILSYCKNHNTWASAIICYDCNKAWHCIIQQWVFKLIFSSTNSSQNILEQSKGIRAPQWTIIHILIKYFAHKSSNSWRTAPMSRSCWFGYRSHQDYLLSQESQMLPVKMLSYLEIFYGENENYTLYLKLRIL